MVARVRIQPPLTGGMIGGYLQEANSIPPLLGVSVGNDCPEGLAAEWR